MDAADENQVAQVGVDRLEPEMRGRWRVVSQNSQHVWDLDEMTYQRLPGQQSNAFDGDGVAAPIFTVRVWPEVGSRFWVYVDDAVDGTVTQWRISSRIRSIVPEGRDAGQADQSTTVT